MIYLADFDELIKAFKKLTKETVEAGVPAGICFGVVTSAEPLTILVDQKLSITGIQIVLTRNVTDYYTDETVNHTVENRAGGSGDASYESHNHDYVGRKSFLIHHSLISGDKVLLLREQGGQRYIVLDRVVM